MIDAAVLMLEAATDTMAIIRLDERLEHRIFALGWLSVAASVFGKWLVDRARLSKRRVFGQQTPIAGTECFHLGSRTKAMTATLTDRFLDAGSI